MKTCVFCGDVGDTKEHIIPRWLQKHFELKDQHLGMANKTRMQYSHVVLPACKRCNSETFSRLEMKVRENLASEHEYYLWALKIRYCLSLVDSYLPDDRSNPAQGPMIRPEFATVGHDFIRHAFSNSEKKRFFFRPYPFGTVILTHNTPEDGEFGFVDVTHPYWALTVTLPKNRLLSVLFLDRGLVKRSLAKRYKSKGGITGFLDEVNKELPSNLYTRFLTFRLLLAQYQISNIPNSMTLKPSGIYSKRLPNKLRYRERLRLEVMVQMADFCGLPQEVANNVYYSFPVGYRGG